MNCWVFVGTRMRGNGLRRELKVGIAMREVNFLYMVPLLANAALVAEQARVFENTAIKSLSLEHGLTWHSLFHSES
jgi:hypothetical protein